MIGIIGAMIEEIDRIKSEMTIHSTKTIGQREFWQGTLHGIETVLVFSRYGKVSAATTSTLLIALYDVEAIIFVGVAGSADPSARIGDIIISDSLVQHDMDCSPLFPRYEIPLLNMSAFTANHKLATYAKQAAETYLETHFPSQIGAQALVFGISNPKSHTGTIASGDQFIKDSSFADGIRLGVTPLTTSPLLAFEMEGAAVAQVCFELNVPFVVIRTISDNADDGAHIDFPKFIQDIAKHYSHGVIAGLYQLIKENHPAKEVLVF